MSTNAPTAPGACPTAGTPAHSVAPVLRRWLTGDPAIVIALIAINLLCFSRTIGGFFLADDYVHVAWLATVFDGHPELLLQNFFSNWMQTQGTQFYRPFISLTLAFDYLVGGGGPLAFHLSNTAFQTLSSIFLFLTARRLLVGCTRQEATVAAFFAGALFAGNPLHPEVVSWVIGRVDSVCTMFYLASFWLFLKSVQDASRKSACLSLGAFAVGLMSKEMAVTLPPALALWCLFAAPPGTPFGRRLVDCLRQTWMWWALTGVYMVVRTAALGTISGGYTGSIGEGLSASLFKRWFQEGSHLKVAFPFNSEVFPPGDSLRRLLRSLYIAAGITLAIRVLSGPRVAGLSRWIGFSLLWFVLTMIPTYQVWNLTDSLLGSRFIYLGTAPLCLLASVLLVPVYGAAAEAAGKFVPRMRLAAKTAGIVILSLLVACLSAVTCRNNLPWAHASSQVRALKRDIEQVVASMPAEKKLVLLNQPQRTEGAHMLYNAAMLGVLLRPPLSSSDLSARVVTFEPMTFGDSDLIIASRLRRLAADPAHFDFYRWDAERQILKPVNLGPSDRELSFDGAQFDPQPQPSTAGEFLVSPAFALPATATDFVDVELTSSPADKAAAGAALMILSWASPDQPLFSAARRLALPVEADGRAHKYRFAVSQHKSWIMGGTINQLRLDLPQPGYINRVESVNLIAADDEIPALSFDGGELAEDDAGVCRMRGSRCRLNYDASRIKGAASVTVEISKPNAWFEHYSGDFRDRSPSPHALSRFKVGAVAGHLDIPAEAFPSAGYYQVRVQALDAKGAPTAYVSDPINLQVAGGVRTRRQDAQPRRSDAS